MFSKRIFGLSALVACGIVLSGVGVLFAQQQSATQTRDRLRQDMPALMTTRTMANESEEDLVVSSDDTPLVRLAKLRRSWHVYREMDSDVIYAIGSDRTKHQINTLDFFTAFDANYKVKLVPEGALDAYETGNPITDASIIRAEDYLKAPMRCRLVRSGEDPAVYLACGAEKRVILRESAFHQNGWEFRDVEVVPQEQVDELTDGEAVTEGTVFDEEVEVDTTVMRETRERLSKRMSLQGKTQVRDRLVKATGDNKVYLVTPDGMRRHVENEEVANRLGLNLRGIIEIPPSELEAFEEAGAVTADTAESVLNEEVEE